MDFSLDDFSTFLEKEKSYSANTVQSYTRDIGVFLRFAEENHVAKIDRINRTTVMSYFLHLHKTSSAASIARKAVSLRVFLQYLFENHLIQEDLADAVEAPKVAKKMPVSLSMEDIVTLIEAPNLETKKGIRDRAMLELLYATGMKIEELLSLEVFDVNLVLEFVKCRKGQARIIPIGRKAVEALMLYLNIARAEFEKESTKILFLNREGKKMSRQGFFKLVKRYADDVFGENSVTPNMIRHSFATHLIRNGCDLQVVQDMLGHTDVGAMKKYAEIARMNRKEMYKNTHPRG